MKRWNDRGQTLVFVALAIFAILALAALGIDAGFMYSVRHELQRSADSGALAGASWFLENPLDDVNTEAYNRAREFASKDNVVTSQLDRLAEVDVEIPSLHRIRVTTHRTVPMFFARVLGRDNQWISATAVAEADVADKKVQCLQPWGIPIPWDDNDHNNHYDPGTDTKWDLPNIDEGTLMVLKIGEPYGKDNEVDIPTLQQESGHFFALAMCGDSGAADYKQRIETPCFDGCGIDNNSFVPLEPGNMVGPTKHAVDSLMKADAKADWSGCAPGCDKKLWVDGSEAPGGWENSARLVKIPLYDPAMQPAEGRSGITVAGFAAFWLEGYDTKQGTVTARFVSSDIKGSSTSGPAPGLALRILRLVE
jgi:hypothetical protein